MWEIAILLSCISVASSNTVSIQNGEKEWTNNIVYQIYPRSFKDSNGDGIGDIRGITSKLEHVKDSGADTFYLSPIYTSPMKDFGYDVSNYTDIHAEFGTLEDFDKLVARAKELNLKIILDFVPNHSSDEHEWFQKSINRIAPYDDYYVWKDPKFGENGERLPPNNWLSLFGHSAWTWNEKRQQYYYHKYLAAQPDLNYRNPNVPKEIENIMEFWLERGIDGFRVDSPNLLYEDKEFRDEPRRPDTDVPPTDYSYLVHIYTRDVDECIPVVASWRKLLDNFSAKHNISKKWLLLEVWGSIPNTIRFYNVGADPFNFRLLFEIDRNSTAQDFARVVGNWLNAIPQGQIANWIVGNHDNHHIASRFGNGSDRADQINMMVAVLPGIMMVYNGDEIGMVNREFTFEEVVDPYGCQAGPERYHLYYRDAQRTPYQWDNSTSAGFSENSKTWLPVHENYKVLNLELQKKAEISHYKVFQALASLKKSSPVLQNGTTEILTQKDVFVIVRRLKGYRPIVLLINFSDTTSEIDAKSWLNIPKKMKVYTASVMSGLRKDDKFNTSRLTLPGAATVILV
ncbi:hypothetical protein QAD02_017657 [Eretmocerus hayati]|uniref:Uncharacterized protein n=1 Tax=Eretmocerus hayati TaxID=131215 RepID=A0ACC2PE76_9HYME|nr:hypothetical protein QAD02_017657 [Eretmocerus hayati]